MAFPIRIISYLVYILAFTFSLLPVVSGMGNLGDILLILIFLVYFASLIFSKSERDIFRRSIYDFLSNRFSQLILLLAAVMIISVSYSMDKTTAIKESIRYLFYVGLFFIVKYRVSNEKNVMYIFFVYISNAVVLSTYGIYQYLSGSTTNKIFLITLSRVRVQSAFENPNSFGGYLVLIIFPLIMLTLRERKVKKLIYLAISLLVFVNLILTLSRGSWLGFAVGLAVLALTYNWKIIFSYLIIGVLGLLVPQISGRLKDFKDVSQNEGRFNLWRTAIAMIKEHFFTGVGNGNYISRYDEYTSKYPELKMEGYTRFPSHNSYLKVFSELGIFGFAFFFAFVIMGVKKVKDAADSVEGVMKSFFTGFIASMAGFYITNVFDNMFFVPKVAVYFWIVIAAAEGIRYRKSGY